MEDINLDELEASAEAKLDKVKLKRKLAGSSEAADSPSPTKKRLQ